jgi:hypothetical protein
MEFSAQALIQLLEKRFAKKATGTLALLGPEYKLNWRRQ